MLSALRAKYRCLFASIEEYHQHGIVISDEVVEIIGDRRESLPVPGYIPRYLPGEKIGEGATSQTYAFPEHPTLTPFPVVVQYHPITIEETYHLAYISSLISQLYYLCPHIVLFVGYFFSPAEAISHQEDEDEEEEGVFPEVDSYGFLYERIPQTLSEVWEEISLDPIQARSVILQLFFTINLLHRCGFHHGDITPANLGWDTHPTWQGYHLEEDVDYYGYIIDGKMYYLPQGPLLRIFDFNLSTYQDDEIILQPTIPSEDDLHSGIQLAEYLLSPEDYLLLQSDPSKYILLFPDINPEPGDRIMVIGKLPD